MSRFLAVMASVWLAGASVDVLVWFVTAEIIDVQGTALMAAMSAACSLGAIAWHVVEDRK